MLTVVTSGKAAPGATTSAWALGLAWPRPVVIADCDPAGGDMAPGYLAGRVVADRGLLSWSAAARRGTPAMDAAAMFGAHAVELPEYRHIWLVPGFATATQAHSFTSETWERLALALERCSAAISRDALVDAGRLVGEQEYAPIFRAADHILLTVRSSVRSVHAAQSAAQRLRHDLGDLAKVSALVIGDGPYSSTEIATALDLQLAATLPFDRSAALLLSDAGKGKVGALGRSALLRAIRPLARRLADQAATTGDAQPAPPRMAER